MTPDFDFWDNFESYSETRDLCKCDKNDGEVIVGDHCISQQINLVPHIIISNYPENRVLYLKIETTGGNSVDDDILSLAIIDGVGAIRYYGYFHPEEKNEWPKAQAINLISNLDVKDSPSFSSQIDVIAKILQESDIIVGYNILCYEFPFLRSVISKIKIKFVCDLMIDYIDYKKNSCNGCMNNPSLIKCTEDLNIKFNPKTCLNKARAILECQKRMN